MTHPVARLLSWGEPLARRALRLEHGANCGPLLHVLCYYAALLAAAVPGVVSSTLGRASLWLLVILLNYSLSIGVLHMHAHRRLFTDARLNRALDLLLAFPAFSTYPVMLYHHVWQHHQGDNGPDDPSSTQGYERWPWMLWYWIRYAWVSKFDTERFMRSPQAKGRWVQLRRQHHVDTGLMLFAYGAWLALDPVTALLYGLIPLVTCHVNVGYFGWLTHAPAGEGPLNGSVNTVCNWMGLFVFNQGYHAIHHAHPGIHWTRIPDHLDMMLEVDDALIVPYWVTLLSAWKGVRAQGYLDPEFGARWKQRLERRRREGTQRLRALPYFAWI